MWNRIKENAIVLLIIAVTVLVTVLLQNFGFQSYSRFASDTLHYERAVVVEVLSEDWSTMRIWRLLWEHRCCKSGC